MAPRKKTLKRSKHKKPGAKRKYPKVYVGSGTLRRRGMKKKPKIGRKGPAISALEKRAGTVMTGQDGHLWVVKVVHQRGKRTHRWVRIKSVASHVVAQFQRARRGRL